MKSARPTTSRKAGYTLAFQQNDVGNFAVVLLWLLLGVMGFTV